MISVEAETTARKFIARINAHDSRGVIALCTADHVFINSLGTRVSGIPRLEQSWNEYVALFPDYRIEVDAMMSAGDLVLLSGWALATHCGSCAPWKIPAAWRATLVNDRIAAWQVYADNKPVYEILSNFAQIQ